MKMIRKVFLSPRHFFSVDSISPVIPTDLLLPDWHPPFIPYLRVYHVESYVIHHHVILHGWSRSKIYWHHLVVYSISKNGMIKGKHPIIGWCESGDHSLASGVGILRLMPASDLPPRTTRLGVFSFRINAYLATSQWDFGSLEVKTRSATAQLPCRPTVKELTWILWWKQHSNVHMIMCDKLSIQEVREHQTADD